MIISVPVCDLYRYPSADSEHIDEAMFGTEVKITDSAAGFVKIITEYGYEGWINQSETANEAEKPNSVITFPWADLLKDDKNFFAPVLTLPFGAKVAAGFSESFPRHAFVILPDKRMYYLRKEALGEPPAGLSEEKAREVIIKTSLSFLGVQYRWGGRTHMGIDCSGLAFNSYRAAGINIWRDAYIEKSPALKRIPLERAKPADLLFFDGHMAVYLGEGKFIHSASSGARVDFASFDENSPVYSEWCAQNLICAGTAF